MPAVSGRGTGIQKEKAFPEALAVSPWLELCPMAILGCKGVWGGECRS